MSKKNRRLARVGAVLTLISGCATYESRPLELNEYVDRWPARDIADETVEAYARQLVSDEQDAPYDASDGLSVTEAEAVALVFNPKLRLARAQAKVPLASAVEAGWWPDPQFQAQVLRFTHRGADSRFRFDGPSINGVNTGVVSGNGVEVTPPGIRRVGGEFIDDPWIIGGSLNVTIPISGRLAVEQDWSWAMYRASWRQILIAEWDVLTQLRAAWLEWSVTRGRLTVVSEYLEQLGAVARIANRLADAGELKPTEARLLDIELQRQRTVKQGLEGQVAGQKLTLLAMLGLAPEVPVDLVPSVFVAGFDDHDVTRRKLLLDRHPRVHASRARYEAAEQRLRLEIREQYPDVTLGPTYSLEEGFSRFGFGISVPLPLWSRNRQAIAEAMADREAARIQAQTTLEAVMSNLAQVEVRLRFASERRRMLSDEVAPLVDRQVTETRDLLELGEINVLVLRDAISSAVETKLELLTATLAEAQAANELQQMLAPRWITPSEQNIKESNPCP